MSGAIKKRSIQCIIVVVALLLIALMAGINSVRNNNKVIENTRIAYSNVINNYSEDDYNYYDASSSKAIIIRSKWNDVLENIDLWAKDKVQIEDDLYLFTFNSANDTYLAMSRVNGVYDYDFEIIFETATETIESTESVVEATEVHGLENTESVENTLVVEKNKVVVAVLDTGYTGTSSKVKNGFSLINEGYGYQDDNGHGTRLVTIIDSMTTDDVEILPIKVANKDGFATILTLYEGINLAIEQNVDIINISLNARVSDNSFLLEEAIRRAEEQGIYVVVSAGNKSIDTVDVVPSNIKEAIVVSAVSSKDKFETYSNYGDTVDFSTYGNYNGVGGTSIAAARMSAMLAYILGTGKDIEYLKEIAYNPDGNYRDEYFGYGIVKPYDLYEDELAYNIMQTVYSKTETTWVGKTDYDLGPNIVNINWKELDKATLDSYLIETHYAFVGEFLSSLSDEEIAELKTKSDVVNRNVEEVEFEFELDVPQDDADEISRTEVNFIEYCLGEYEIHKNDLAISSDYWWYNNTGTFWLRDNSGETCFRIYAPTPYYNSADDKSTVKWDDSSVNSSDTSDGYMKVTKVARSDNAGPTLAGARVIQSGYSNYISIRQKKNEVTGALEKQAYKSALNAANKSDDGSVSTLWQFSFSNYYVGTTQEGYHFKSYLNGDKDLNVRPYGYWDKSEEYWIANATTDAPSGKIHTYSESENASEHAVSSDWINIIPNMEVYDNTICQNYVYIDKDMEYKSTLQTIRPNSYSTTYSESLDVLHYWYSDGTSKATLENIADTPLLKYTGETSDTVLAFKDKYPDAKFIRVDTIDGFAKASDVDLENGNRDSERYLPAFSSEDYPGSEKMLELGRCVQSWVYKCAYNSNAKEQINDNMNNFVNNNIVLRGLESSYDPDRKTLQVTGSYDDWGLSQTDYGHSEGGVKKPTKTKDSDIPEVFIQTERNTVRVMYTAHLSDVYSDKENVLSLFNNNFDEANCLVEECVSYGEILTKTPIKPTLSSFKSTENFKILYLYGDKEAEDLSHMTVNEAVQYVLSKTNESGGTLVVSREYEPIMSTVVVNPSPGRWAHDDVIYGSGDLYTEVGVEGMTMQVKAPVVDLLNYTATFYKYNGTVSTTLTSNYSWDSTVGWILTSGNLNGEHDSEDADGDGVIDNTPNGSIVAAEPGAGTNLLAYCPLYAKQFFLNSSGQDAYEANNAVSIDGSWQDAIWTRTKSPLTFERGIYYFKITTGNVPCARINSTYYSQEKGNYLGERYMEFTADWTFHSSIQRYYTYRKSETTIVRQILCVYVLHIICTYNS